MFLLALPHRSKTCCCELLGWDQHLRSPKVGVGGPSFGFLLLLIWTPWGPHLGSLGLVGLMSFFLKGAFFKSPNIPEAKGGENHRVAGSRGLFGDCFRCFPRSGLRTWSPHGYARAAPPMVSSLRFRRTQLVGGWLLQK